MEVPRNLTQDFLSRIWQEYADDCFCHDPEPCVLYHVKELAHSEDRVLAGTARTV